MRDGVGHHAYPALVDLAKQIAIGHGADPLVPGLVARGEVASHIHLATQRQVDHLHQIVFEKFGPSSGELKVKQALQNVFPSGDVIPHSKRQPAVQAQRQRVAGWAAHHIRRRALQHGHMRGGLRHGRHQGDGGGATSHHHHPFASMVQPGRPKLRVNHLALEVLKTCKVGLVTLGKAVITTAQIQKLRLLMDLSAIRQVGRDAPASINARPCGACHPVAIGDVLCHAGFLRGFLDVVQDGGPIGHGLLAAPRFEAVAQGVHVRVRANAGVAEQIPGTTQLVAGFPDAPGFVRALHLQMTRSTNARQTRTNDQDIQHVQSITFARVALVRPRNTLLSTRFRCEENVGLVARRGLMGLAANATISCNLAMASARFLSWLRVVCALMTMTPSSVMR